ncbi:DUF1572 domain-containing protein [Mucilaginibacter sp. RS28]|uniref:DUF1572 domain-containing protein n=1 Tax=Mucilaginibacter straminoryzae TaxID=2932774 RepID=A0A9X1X3Z8_9SPHI|nr:DinB family protein [Mucilaginibacter straminoryzae]MCJ8209248.1 DUF1572 domain-containing protein [Mucilaginibacter straminoryzae]
MDTSAQLAKHLKEVYFGGNWTASNLTAQLADVSWQEAIAKVGTLNTIAALSYHIGYYVTAISSVLKGQPLTAKDKFSFDHPPVESEEAWSAMLMRIRSEAEELIRLIEGLPSEALDKDFADPKYGTYYRNLLGLIEHTHYHLGQIAVIKKLIRERV